MTGSEGNGFQQYKLMLLDRLDRFEEEIKALRQEVAALHGEVVALKVKAGLWGALAGALGPALMAIFYLLVRASGKPLL